MTFENALSFLSKAQKFSKKPGLERITKLMNLLGNPQKNLKFIHFAGTNGKGSTVTMTANALIHRGYKIGKFMSPFVYSWGERITVNNKEISPQKLKQLVDKVEEKISQNMKDDYPTEFEIVSAIGFLYFAEENCDYVCLEVGLGGRFDGTNVIDSPFLSVITKISFDHTDILGDTLEKIAVEKCEIIKNSPTVSYAKQYPQVVETILDYNEKTIFPDINSLKIIKTDINGSEISYKNEIYNISMIGEHQIYNALTVIEICNKLTHLGLDLSQDDIKYALSNSLVYARMEIISKNPLFIIDGSHNIDAIDALVSNFHRYFQNKSITLIMGMVKDKDYKKAVEKASDNVDNLILVPIDTIRSCEPFELSKYSKCKNTYVFDNIKDALKLVDNLGKDVCIACGSLYLACEIKGNI